MNVDDARFSAIYETADYNIDPSAPEFKATKNMDTLIQEKLKRKSKITADKSKAKKAKVDNQSTKPSVSKDASLASLVTSVKSKTKSLQKKS